MRNGTTLKYLNLISDQFAEFRRFTILYFKKNGFQKLKKKIILMKLISFKSIWIRLSNIILIKFEKLLKYLN